MRFIFIIIKSIAAPESLLCHLSEPQPASEPGQLDEAAGGRSEKKARGVNPFNPLNLPSPRTNPLLRR